MWVSASFSEPAACSLADLHVEGCAPRGQDGGHPGGVGAGSGGARSRLQLGWASAGEGGSRTRGEDARDLPPRRGARPQPDADADAASRVHSSRPAASGALRPAPGSAGEGTLSAGPAGSRSRERRRAPQPF